MPLYVEMPEYCVFKQRKWKIREQGSAIGRVHTVNPLSGDVFYLQILLHNDHCRGKTSFEDVKKVQDKACKTYQEVSWVLGL